MARSITSKGRPYRLGRRAETAEQTRQRIVEATFALHNERGIADTTMKRIAERAGVSVGTVYHHFPTYPDAIAACGAHSVRQCPAPAPAIFDGSRSREDRIRRLAAAQFDWYERLPALASVRRDAHLAETLQAHVEHEARNRRALAGLALGDDTARERDVVAALVDLDAYRSFRRQGFAPARAAEAVAALLNAWLDRGATSSLPLPELTP